MMKHLDYVRGNIREVSFSYLLVQLCVWFFASVVIVLLFLTQILFFLFQGYENCVYKHDISSSPLKFATANDVKKSSLSLSVSYSIETSVSASLPISNTQVLVESSLKGAEESSLSVAVVTRGGRICCSNRSWSIRDF